ncbi:hypothetical protein D5281_23125 [bacterium 1xD42-62]|uniref:Uncharacterized protein n=1 Tax=Parablautia muri TaxID=2320879 RepID=A0A9X5BK06_9FIRM|nr:hypothetical protein [Parablautia muri]
MVIWDVDNLKNNTCFGRAFFYSHYTQMGGFMLKYQGSKFFELLILNKACYELKILAVLYFIILNEKQS